jgi:hypothetical protein
MRIGKSIRHHSLGDGTVLAVYPKGGQAGAEVDFGYMTEWISSSELGEQGADESENSATGRSLTQTEPLGASRPLLRFSGDVVDARRGVLALKLGQVLEEQVLQLSTGIEKVRTDLETAIARAIQRQARCVLIEGGWGSGKTHLLTMLSAIASTSGMATSSVILDGDGVTLSDPMSLMEALLSSLRYPGEHAPCGLSRRLSQLRHSEARRELHHRGDGRIAAAIGELPASAFDEPEVMQVLEDYFTLTVSATQANSKLANLGWRSVGLPALSARTVDERPHRFCELLQEWTEFVALTGAKGLVLIIDEVDVDYARSVWEAELRRRRTGLLRALAERVVSKLPLVVAFGGAPSGDVEEEHDPVRDLKRLLGSDVLKIEAPKPDLQQMRQLAQRVRTLYERAYPERMTVRSRYASIPATHFSAKSRDALARSATDWRRLRARSGT